MRLKLLWGGAVLLVWLGGGTGCADETWPSTGKSPGHDSGPDRALGVGDVSVEGESGPSAVDGGEAGIDPRDVETIPDVSVDVAIADVTTRADGSEASRPGDMSCRTSQSAEPIPARSVVTSADAGVEAFEEIFVATGVFNPFYNACGGCHVDANFGGLKVSLVDFKPGSQKVGQPMLDRMTSDDPNTVMPPVHSGGSINSQRKPGDPVIQLITRFSQWIAAGQPEDLFKVPRTTPQPGDTNGYVMTPDRGQAMTNIGDCIPGAGLIGASPSPTKAQKLDAMFAALKKAPPGSATPVSERIGLPEHLADTDLYTLDAASLAQDRVIAYAPTYPLWSDNARKIRHVRVPLGQSIRFDKQTQTFDIPANTRFYKTFLKPVIEKGGSLRYRKIETRLIVARPDIDGADGKAQNTSLFGSYKWDDAEQAATLVTETLNNTEPFKDQLLTLVLDEDKAEAVRAATPPGENVATALEQARATRKYAIPGSDRCIQCHMGSPTKDFILGFFPLQVRRRPTGEGGTIEPAGPDELTQLERFISYGIITGITSPSDVTTLEASQGTRKPRNDYELAAQGYALGNCAHCHNPRGFPTAENPVLRDVLNFLPNADPVEESEGCRKQGGIFQFPLGCTSPRIQRGPLADVPIPYITPSLVDYPAADDNPQFPAKVDVPAPWRSLIYRNVDTPFTYEDEGAIYPHMPVNVPGFDCRAPRILGEWMVSIPAVRTVRPDVDERAIKDTSPQPYKEVKPPDPKYAAAVTQADERVDKYEWGYRDAPQEYRFSRHSFCPDTSNIQDPYVTLEDSAHLAPPIEYGYDLDKNIVMPIVGTPRRPHWVVTDLSQVRTDSWHPRRDDWEKVLVHDCLCNEKKTECRKADGRTDSTYGCLDQDPATPKKRAQVRVIGLLKGTTPAGGVHVSESFRNDVAREKVPLGLWQQRSDCNYSTTHTVGWWRNPPASQAALRPKWIDVANAPDGAPVFEVSRGAAVFGMICINCHGAQADSRGRMADTVLTMTGGSTRVANLRDGLFGAAGANRNSAFGGVSNADTSADDWGGRYMAWMALGGTSKVLPSAVLNVVANTRVLGTQRKGVTSLADPNMLETAKHLCRFVLPSEEGIESFDPAKGAFDYANSDIPLIATNGDLELWQHLCTEGNMVPVRALVFNVVSGQPILYPNSLGLMRPDNYPKDHAVGNHLGQIEIGIQPGNRLPWCWNDAFSDPAKADAYAREHGIVDLRCPPGFGLVDSDDNRLTDEEKEAWAERGAINAGLSVFVYLDDLTRNLQQPFPNYADCPSTGPAP